MYKLVVCRYPGVKFLKEEVALMAILLFGKCS